MSTRETLRLTICSSKKTGFLYTMLVMIYVYCTNFRTLSETFPSMKQNPNI